MDDNTASQLKSSSSPEEELIAYQHICERWMLETGSPDCEMNDTQLNDDLNNPLSYRIIATLLHVIIFFCGVSGNIVLIFVARRTKALQKPTYCYLTSLAYADLIVLISAVPEAILSHHIGVRWVLGQTGCSMLVFTNFLGINAGSLSILAFTIERYIAVLKPILAQKVCTVERATKIIVILWILSILYCSPWLGLTEVRLSDPNGSIWICDFRLSPTQYTSFFTADLILFYVVPLLCATFVYGRIANQIGWTIPKSSAPKLPCDDCDLSVTYNGELRIPPTRLLRPDADSIHGSFRKFVTVSEENGFQKSIIHRSSAGSFNRSIMRSEPGSVQGSTRRKVKRSRTQALHVLMVVVIIFAICWLPYRGLLLYNSFFEKGWWDIWYLLFAKTLIYVNSAINPFLYNFMSSAFHEAVCSLFRTKRRTSTTFSTSI